MTSRAANDSRGTPEGSSSRGFTGRFRGRFSGRLRKRLFLQVYGALCGALLLFALAASLAWMMAPRDRDAELFLEGMAELVGEALPPADRPPDQATDVLERLASRFKADLTLLDPGGRVLAHVGPPLALPPWAPRHSAVVHARGRGMVASLVLPDGRRLLADHSRGHHRPFPAGVALFALMAALLALASWPVARRLTRRLERLRGGVDGLGRGDLGARVPVEGSDEVADLARSFNAAAERIEKLVHAQKDALATASHELRSPLARMRVALELLGPDTRPDVLARIAHDIDELDELIGEILLTSRLDASPAIERRDDVDLLALLAEEGARVGAEVGVEAGAPRAAGDGTGNDASGAAAVVVRGDTRLLRRLVRNLFENARRYGAGSPIEATVSAQPGGGAVLRVLDRGPGIPDAERERVFEAFYRRSGTSEADGGGVGLGLALVRRIAAAHGGAAKALARDGGGTVIEVTLG